ncbi:Glucose/carbohydrate outer membrane porin OprB precursor, partial [Pseudomonas aeruginosa]
TVALPAPVLCLGPPERFGRAVFFRRPLFPAACYKPTTLFLCRSFGACVRNVVKLHGCTPGLSGKGRG